MIKKSQKYNFFEILLLLLLSIFFLISAITLFFEIKINFFNSKMYVNSNITWNKFNKITKNFINKNILINNIWKEKLNNKKNIINNTWLKNAINKTTFINYYTKSNAININKNNNLTWKEEMKNSFSFNNWLSNSIYNKFLNKINFFNLWTINKNWILKKPNIIITSKFWYRIINWKKNLHTWIDVVNKWWMLLYLIKKNNNCYFLPFTSKNSYWNALLCKVNINNNNIWYLLIWHLTNTNKKELLTLMPPKENNSNNIIEIKKVFAFVYSKINNKKIKNYKWIKIPKNIYKLKWKKYIFKFWDTWFAFWKHMHISVLVYNKKNYTFYLVDNTKKIFNFVKNMSN